MTRRVAVVVHLPAAPRSSAESLKTRHFSGESRPHSRKRRRAHDCDPESLGGYSKRGQISPAARRRNARGPSRSTTEANDREPRRLRSIESGGCMKQGIIKGLAIAAFAVAMSISGNAAAAGPNIACTASLSGKTVYVQSGGYRYYYICRPAFSDRGRDPRVASVAARRARACPGLVRARRPSTHSSSRSSPGSRCVHLRDRAPARGLAFVPEAPNMPRSSPRTMRP